LDTYELRQTLFIEVLLPLNLQNTFTYRVPFELNEEIEVGKRVSVPFGKKKVMAGVIVAIGDKPPEKYEAKYIFDVVDNTAIVSEDQISFWNWLARYYMCSTGLVYNAAMPAGLKLEGESILTLHPDANLNQELDPDEDIIIQALHSSIELSVTQANAIVKTNRIHKIIQSLYLKGLVLLKEDLSAQYKPKKKKHLQIHPDIRNDEALNDLFNQLEKRAKEQLKVLMTFIAKHTVDGEVEKQAFASNDISKSALTSLINKGIIVQDEREESRLDFSEEDKKPEELNEDQQRAYQEIQAAFEMKKPVLLYGVTSSGKTHIYIHLIQEALQKSEQVLYLLPEIALTSQLIERLAVYFGTQLVVSHSKFSNNERVEVYNEIKAGKPLLIVGTRSAVFLPFQNLGLILVDEEHEGSFKQFEPAPRFNARDTALYLASKKPCPIVLGSATPAIESFYNAQKNKYALVKLTKRFANARQPEMVVVDMAQQKKQKRNKGVFSDTLLDAIEQTHKNGKQTILFQNRKGYVPVLECNICSWTPKCKHCDISLTFYKYQNNLRCHYCGYTEDVVHQCKACGNTGIELIGYGTERIEDELKLQLPELKIKRLDYNTTRHKNAHQKIIQDFAQGKIDVLIGTQMVAKGLDFDDVNTVGIINADHLINFPDFRANERTFQLLTQVAGRAGRREDLGTVYIQTSKPNHFIVEQLVNGDYEGMYAAELAERENFDYPPFYRLIKITLKHKDALELYKLGQKFKHYLLPHFGDKLLGPEKPYVSKIRNMYLLNFVLKLAKDSKDLSKNKQILAYLINQLKLQKEFKTSRIVVDVDPV
jgi:primosomal protein N' (replication factor Y)